MRTNSWVGEDGKICMEIDNDFEGEVFLDEDDIIELYAIAGNLAAEIMNRRAKSEKTTPMAIER